MIKRETRKANSTSLHFMAENIDSNHKQTLVHFICSQILSIHAEKGTFER